MYLLILTTCEPWVGPHWQHPHHERQSSSWISHSAVMAGDAPSPHLRFLAHVVLQMMSIWLRPGQVEWLEIARTFKFCPPQPAIGPHRFVSVICIACPSQRCLHFFAMIRPNVEAIYCSCICAKPMPSVINSTLCGSQSWCQCDA